MTSTFTPNKDLEKPAHDDYVDNWDIPVNGNSNALDAALGSTSYVNLTAQSSYTLTYTDLQARTIAFTGTLNNATVAVKLTNGVSFEGEIVNLTASGGSSSLLQLGWTGAGNTCAVNQGTSQTMIADGLNPSTTGWQIVSKECPNYASASAFGANAGAGDTILSLDVTGLSPGTATALTAAQLRAKVLKVTGTMPNGSVTYRFPSGVGGLWGVMWNVTGGGGFSQLSFNSLGGGTSVTAFTGGTASGALTVITDGSGNFFRSS